MRKLVCMILATLIATCLSAAAEDVAAIAKLIEILPAEPGRKACYRRIYNATHLRAHPKQRVTAVTFLLRVVRYDAQGTRYHTPATKPDDWTGYQFAMAVQRRGERRTLSTSGDCFGYENASCAVDCDGGGVTLEKARAKALLVRLPHSYGIRMSSGCGEGKGAMLTPGSDDKVFRLHQVADRMCGALEKQQLGD